MIYVGESLHLPAFSWKMALEHCKGECNSDSSSAGQKEQQGCPCTWVAPDLILPATAQKGSSEEQEFANWRKGRWVFLAEDTAKVQDIKGGVKIRENS